MEDEDYIYYGEMQISDKGYGEFSVEACVSEGNTLLVTSDGLIAAARAILAHFNEVEK